jgi:PTS system galactitol-specific IIB component
MTKRVIVCCGGGVATSSIVMNELKNLIKDNNLDATLFQCPISELPSEVLKSDLIVTTVRLYKKYDIPVINAVGFLTGRNIDEIRQQVVEVLREE